MGHLTSHGRDGNIVRGVVGICSQKGGNFYLIFRVDNSIDYDRIRVCETTSLKEEKKDEI